MNGTVQAKGGNSISDQGATYGAGGGSGGSISITTASVNGTADSLISVAGGIGRQGGGGGGGGWIYGYLQNSTSFDVGKTVNWHGRFNISEGTMLELINLDTASPYTGQISHPACQPGFESVFCSPCVPGFFQNDTSNQKCMPCTNKPNQNSKYTFAPGSQVNEKCPYACIASVPNVDKNPQCFNSFDWFIDKIGGWAVVA